MSVLTAVAALGGLTLVLASMLVATDCPYLTPQPFRGGRTEPDDAGGTGLGGLARCRAGSRIANG